MKRIGLFTGWLFAMLLLPAGTPRADAPDSTGERWALDRCLHEASTASHRLAAQRSRIEAAEAAAREARANRLPSAALEGAYSHTSETMSLHLPAPVPGFTLPEISFGDGNVYDASLVLNIPLFTGGGLTQKARAAGQALRAARFDYAADSLLVLHEVRAAYYAALGAEAQLAARRRSLQRLSRHLKELEAAHGVGAASEEMLVQVAGQLQRAEEMVIEAEGEYHAACLSLGRLVGRAGSAVSPAGDLDSSLLAEPAEPVEVRRRAEVGAMDARLRQSHRLASAARGAFLPSLSARAAYHYGKPGVDIIANEWTDYATVGVALKWTLWDWSARKQRVQQTVAAGRSLEERRRELLDALTTRVSIAETRLAAAVEQRKRAEERLRLRERRLQLVEGRYRQGNATESEYLDAEDDAAVAETELTAATVRVRMMEVELLYARGI